MFYSPHILTDSPPDHPGENMLHSSKIAYKDHKFRKKCDELSLKSLYEVQQQQQEQHIGLMNTLTEILPEFHSLPFNLWGTNPELIYSLANSFHELLWYQHLIYCGEHTLKDIHEHVDGIPNLNKIKFNDLINDATCLKANIAKSPAGHKAFVIPSLLLIRVYMLILVFLVKFLKIKMLILLNSVIRILEDLIVNKLGL